MCVRGTCLSDVSCIIDCMNNANCNILHEAKLLIFTFGFRISNVVFAE